MVYVHFFLLSLNAERALAEALLVEWTEETLLFVRKEVLSWSFKQPHEFVLQLHDLLISH
jgi:hypothetical protein